MPKAFEQDTPPNSNRQNGTHHQHDSILQAFLTRDTNNMRIQKEAVFDHRKIELITQRLFEQLVRHLVIFCLRVAEQRRAAQGSAGQHESRQAGTLTCYHEKKTKSGVINRSLLDGRTFGLENLLLFSLYFY